MNRAALLALGLALVHTGPAGAAAGGTPAVAVMEFEANDASPADAATVAQFVRSALVRTRRFAVVDKHNMDKILAEQAFQRTGCVSESCAVELGKILNVSAIMFGSYGLFEGVRVVSLQLVDVRTGHIVASETERFRGADFVEGAGGLLVTRLVDGSEPEPDIADERRVNLLSRASARRAGAEESAHPRVWLWLTLGLLMAVAFGGVVATIQ